MQLKSRSLIVPLVLLLLGAGGFLAQRQAIAAAGERCEILRRRLAAATGNDKPPGVPDLGERVADPALPLDWRQISARLQEFGRFGEVDGTRLYYKLRQRFEGMGSEELAALGREISGLELNATARSQLLGILLEVLGKKDPVLALASFGGYLPDGDDGIKIPLRKAFASWLDSAPADAIAWLDAETVAGHLVGKGIGSGSDEQNVLEAMVVKNLLATDIPAVFDRLDTFSRDQRTDFFQDLSRFQISSANQAAFTEMVRAKYPGRGSDWVIAQVALGLVNATGLEAVGDYLDLIHADSGEREWAVGHVAGKKLEQILDGHVINRDDFEDLHRWVEANDPEHAAALTASLLTRIPGRVNGVPFGQVAVWAAEIDRTSGSDTLLLAVVKRTVENQADRAASQATVETIADPSVRAKALEFFRQTTGQP